MFGYPLGTQINSRGDPADTGTSRAVTINTIGNGGHLSFIVNSVNLTLMAGLGSYITANAMRYVAGLLEITPADVEDVASFYTMFYTKPVGAFVHWP